MAYVRIKEINGNKYYYVVRSKWVKGGNTAKQENLEYIGSVKEYSREEAEAIAKEYEEENKD